MNIKWGKPGVKKVDSDMTVWAFVYWDEKIGSYTFAGQPIRIPGKIKPDSRFEFLWYFESTEEVKRIINIERSMSKKCAALRCIIPGGSWYIRCDISFDDKDTRFYLITKEVEVKDIYYASKEE